MIMITIKYCIYLNSPITCNKSYCAHEQKPRAQIGSMSLLTSVSKGKLSYTNYPLTVTKYRTDKILTVPD